MDEINRDRLLAQSPKLQGFRLALRVDEACSALGISRSSLYELIASGEVRTSRIAGRRLIPVKELERLLSTGEQKSD